MTELVENYTFVKVIIVASFTGELSRCQEQIARDLNEIIKNNLPAAKGIDAQLVHAKVESVASVYTGGRIPNSFIFADRGNDHA